jgi:hypothetical protein
MSHDFYGLASVGKLFLVLIGTGIAMAAFENKLIAAGIFLFLLWFMFSR